MSHDTQPELVTAPPRPGPTVLLAIEARPVSVSRPACTSMLPPFPLLPGAGPA